MRRLLVGVVSGVAFTLVGTTAAAGQMTLTAWIAVALLAGTELACLIVAARPLGPRFTAVVTVVGALLPFLGSAGRAPNAASYGSGVWYVAGALALILLLFWAHRSTAGWVIVTVLVVHTFLWGGVSALASLSVLAMVILLGAVSAARTAIVQAEAALERSTRTEREAIGWRSVQEAYHQERQTRLAATAITTETMLQQIVDAAGRLTALQRQECRLLEQTVRDEIRGRRLLNPAVREQILTHRRRGATVQVNDDGGLDGEDAATLDELLSTLSKALRGLTSERIIIRTLEAGSPNAISIVATTSDPIAAALGIDSDNDQVDLWLELPRPISAPNPPARQPTDSRSRGTIEHAA